MWRVSCHNGAMCEDSTADATLAVCAEFGTKCTSINA
eukprot:COSAG03_NODE_28496_length_198_cov_13.545455_1_plen_36_part_10